jgi:O-antigen/teichoic acid export membrane protein
MARLLLPSDYGLVGMMTVFIVVSDLFISSGFGSALNKMRQRTENDYSTVFIFNFSIALTIYLALYCSSSLIAEFYNEPLLNDLVKIQSLSLLINSLGIVPMTMLQIKLDFRKISVITVSSSIISGCAGIYMAYNGLGVWALVYSTLIGCVSRIFFLYISVRWFPHAGFSYSSFHNMFSYGSKIMLSILVDVVYTNIYPLVIGKVYSASSLGFYSRGQGYANLPSSTLTMMINRVCFPAFCKQNDDIQELIKTYMKTMINVAFISSFTMLMLLSLSEPLVIALISNKWAASIPILKVLCLATMWYPIQEVNLALLKAIGLSSLVLKMQLVSKLFAVIVLVYTLQFNVIVMCYGAVIVSLFSIAVNFYMSSKHIGLSFWQQIKLISPSIVCGGVMSLSILILIGRLTDIYLQCFLGFLVGSFVYMLVARCFGFSVIQSIKNAV